MRPSSKPQKQQPTGLVSINTGDLHLHIDAINVQLKGSSLSQAGQQELATALKSAVLDAAPSADAARLTTPTRQPAPRLEPLPPLVPPFTCIYVVKIPDVSALAMGSDGHNFVCGHESGEVALWDVRKPGQRLVAALGNGERVHSVAVSADCGRVLAGCRDGLWLWDVERGRTAGLMEYDRDDKSGQKHLNVWSVAVTPDGRYGVSGGVVEGLRVWDLEKGECVSKADSMGCVIRLGISPSGDTATALVKAPLVGERQRPDGCGRVRLQVWKWHAGSGFSMPAEVKGDTYWVELGLPADGGMVLVVDAFTGNLHRWDVQPGQKKVACEELINTQSGAMAQLALSADGRRAVLSTYRGNLWVLDVEGRACLATLPAHMGHVVRDLAVSSDGCHAVSYSEDDGRLCVWHLG